ncbi:ABC transporter ATP-binding protein [Jeotgalibacillus haloalkalitolerans]|uniref:ABC transporter ATP-binding protein n=1 Tax=Jeotgalibacillus haloalkalitolerans TaxID=3104292 RepID=A0ABU5KIB1_9BACL|nr:ABC transporter ATP-binding protein [Jeotgalibacillus sp. HH7-29]MDZ5710863.1 ABC transporter ATP-binding protein [Jeotgalibacillus sp. HH7-29]
MTILHIEHLSKRFGKFQALKDVSFTIRKGEIFGFIGPNGAGKSTTIRTLLGIIKPTSGGASIFGLDVWKDSVDIHKRIAYVPGDANLWPNLTGGEVIDLFLKLRDSYNPEKKQELIKRFQLDPSKKCRTYSKGNRQKVTLVAAFASDAELFILDEPTSGLDPLMERVFQECVLEAKSEGKSVLLSSHILSEVERLCDRVAIIRQGEIIESGSLDEMRHLTRTNLVVETRAPLNGISDLPGVHDVKHTEKGTSLQVDAEALDIVIKKLSTLGITRLESTPPTLEDLFMRHYEGTGSDQR